MTSAPIDPRVGVEHPPRLPELEGLPAGAQWQLVALVHEKHKAGRAGSRAVRVAAVFLVWLLGLGSTLELILSSRDIVGAVGLGLVVVASTAGIAWAVSAWLRRLWLRMKVAELRDSRGCHRCDYPLPIESPEPTCPECGLINDLRQRTWWRGEVTTGRGA